MFCFSFCAFVFKDNTDGQLMSGVEELRKLVGKLIDAGARAVYLSDDNGLELLFMGDEKYKRILQVLPSVRSWVLYQVDMKYMMDLRVRSSISVSCRDIPVFQLNMNVDGSECIFVSYHGLSIGCVHPSDADITSFDLIDVLRNVIRIIKSRYKKEDTIESLRQHILSARKSMSVGDKKALLENLSMIKICIDNLQNPHLRRYSEYISKLINIIREAEMSRDIEKKAKRGLLIIFRNVIRILDQEY